MFDFDLRRKIGFRRRLTPMDSRRRPRPRLDRRNAVKNIDYDAASTSWASSSSAPDPSPALSPSGLRASRSLDLSPSDFKTSFRIGGGVDGDFDLFCRSLGLSGPEDFAIPAAAWEEHKSRSSPAPSPTTSVANLQVSAKPDAISSNLRSPVVPGSNLRSAVALRGGDRVIRDAGSPDLSRLRSPGAGAGHQGGRPVRDNNTEVTVTGLRSPVRIRDAELPNLSSLDVRDSDEVAVSNLRSPASGGEGDRGIRGARPPVLLSPNLSRVRDGVIGSNLGGDRDRDGNRDRDRDRDEDRDRDRGIRRLSPLSPAAPVVSPPSGLLPPPPMSRRYLDKMSSAWDIVKSFAPDEEGEDLPRRTEVEVVEGGAGGEEVRVAEMEEELTGSCSFSTDNEDDSSSTTTEPAQVISPSANGKFRRIISSWEKGRLLGSGSFGTVYEGISDDGNFFAVKEVSLIDQGANAKQCIFQLEQEIALLSRFEHENIVQYYGTDKEEANLFIFLELVTQGSLASLYQRYHLRDSQVSAYTRQILSGLKYLHDQNVVHRDIKCTNILVHANGSIKLADFGLAKEITKLNVLKSCKGSVYWMAPEVIQPKKTYGSAADIWSLGCTVLEMLTRQVPYPNLEWTQALFRIGRGEKPVIPDSLSSDARDFISLCVQVNPADRPSAAKLLDHPFVKRSLSAYSSDGSSHGTGR